MSKYKFSELGLTLNFGFSVLGEGVLSIYGCSAGQTVFVRLSCQIVSSRRNRSLDHHWILGLSECQKRIVSSRRNRSWCHPLFSCCSWRRQSLWLRSCLRVKKITNKSILFIKGVRQIILALGGVFFFWQKWLTKLWHRPILVIRWAQQVRLYLQNI